MGGCPAGPERWPDTDAAARRHQAVHHILQEPWAYQPGSQTLYSDLGFILLADVIATRYQQPLDRLFHEWVAQPLGLRCTGYRPLAGPSPLSVSPTAYAATETCAWRARTLVGEVHDENAWAMGGVAGHAGLFASAADLWRFAHGVLESAAGRRDWLPPALLQESWQRHATPPGTTRALGWDTPTPGRSSAGDYFSARSIGHLGFTGCSLWIDLAQQVTVILCTNRVHPTRHAPGITSLRPAVHNLVMQCLGVATT
jgi:CubicO group peptidase (beta-lactamase class C family)